MVFLDCVSEWLFNTTVEYQILMRQLAMRNEKDHAFINRIQEVIQKYNLEPVEKLIEQPKSKEEWKRIVKLHRNNYCSCFTECTNGGDIFVVS
jgi:hypothetical protein